LVCKKCFSSPQIHLTSLHFLHPSLLGVGLLYAFGSSKDFGVIFTVVGPAEWVGPSVELALVQRSMILVVIVGLSANDQMVNITKVNLGWSLRLFVLEHHLLRDSSLLHALSSHLNEDEVIIIASVLPAEWVGPSMEFSLANHIVLIGLSQKCGVIIKLSKIWNLDPLNVLVVSWDIVLELGGEGLLAPVVSHPRVSWLWFFGSSVELDMEVWMHVLDLGVGIPGLTFIVLGLSGGHVWLSGEWVWHGVRILIEVEILNVDWEAIWSANGSSR